MSETIQPEGAEPDTCPRVFVTYSHDSEEHKSLVREFCTVLRRDAGVDVHLDQWDDDGRVDWSLWAMEQIREADFILAIASPAYRVRAEGLAPADEGRGAQFEAALLRDGLTRDLVEQTGRILPVVLPGRSVKEIPSFLRPYSTTHYLVDELTVAGVEGLLAALNNVAKHPKPVIRIMTAKAMLNARRRQPARRRSSSRSPCPESNPPARSRGRRGRRR
jgi:hypothetical protein